MPRPFSGALLKQILEKVAGAEGRSARRGSSLEVLFQLLPAEPTPHAESTVFRQLWRVPMVFIVSGTLKLPLVDRRSAGLGRPLLGVPRHLLLVVLSALDFGADLVLRGRACVLQVLFR